MEERLWNQLPVDFWWDWEVFDFILRSLTFDWKLLSIVWDIGEISSEILEEILGSFSQEKEAFALHLIAVAQTVEYGTGNAKVMGSIPKECINYLNICFNCNVICFGYKHLPNAWM